MSHFSGFAFPAFFAFRPSFDGEGKGLPYRVKDAVACGDSWWPTPDLDGGARFVAVAVLRGHLGFGPAAGGGLPFDQGDALAPAGCMPRLV